MRSRLDSRPSEILIKELLVAQKLEASFNSFGRDVDMAFRVCWCSCHPESKTTPAHSSATIRAKGDDGKWRESGCLHLLFCNPFHVFCRNFIVVMAHCERVGGLMCAVSWVTHGGGMCKVPSVYSVGTAPELRPVGANVLKYCSHSFQGDSAVSW